MAIDPTGHKVISCVHVSPPSHHTHITSTSGTVLLTHKAQELREEHSVGLVLVGLDESVELIGLDERDVELIGLDERDVELMTVVVDLGCGQPAGVSM